MSRVYSPRASTAVAMLASVIAVSAVMLPGIGFGETSTFRGGSPSDVFMQTNPGFCATVDGSGGSVIQQEVTLSEESHLLVYFTFEWGTLSQTLEGLVDIPLLASDGTVISGSQEWGFAGSSMPRTSGTVMWSFDGVLPGTYTVHGAARVDATPAGGHPVGGAISAGLNECALTVFVLPFAE
jgi:hypothetical protein